MDQDGSLNIQENGAIFPEIKEEMNTIIQNIIAHEKLNGETVGTTL